MISMSDKRPNKYRPTFDEWTKATENLIKRRRANNHDNDIAFVDPRVADYGSHVQKCGFGRSVLDVGCGFQYLKKFIPDGVEYVGIDAFPMREDIPNMVIEFMDNPFLKFDSVYAFAVLDNCWDFEAAMNKIRRIAQKNVAILTGVNIPPDEFHTYELTLDDIDQFFEGWDNNVREEIAPNVWLLNYQRP